MSAQIFEYPKASLEIIEICIRDIHADVPQIRNWYIEYAKAHKNRIAFDYDLTIKYCNPASTIVELACVPLLLTLPLKKTGFRIIGVDLHPERFQSTIDRFGLDIRKCDIENETLPFPDGFCDAVLFNEVIEHLRINLIFTMKEVLRIIKPGGLLFLSTPNLRSLHGMKNFLFKKVSQSNSTDIYNEYSKLESLGHMGHVREYTAKEIVNFLKKAGFVNEEIIYRGRYENKIENLITKLRPNLRPFFSCIAKKPC